MPQVTVEQAMHLAIGHHQAGRFQDAQTIYRQILTVHPDHPDALHLLGVIAGQAGRYEVAADLIRQAIAAAPNNPKYHCNLAIFLKNQGHVDDAIAGYQRAIELKPDYLEAHFNLGIAHYTKGHIDKSIDCYQRALALKPDYAQAHCNLAIALREKGQLDRAIASCRQALSIKPDYADAHNNLGIALAENGQFEKAIACYRHALSLKLDYPELHNNLGSAFRETGQFPQAIAAYQRAIDLKPDYAQAHNNLGNVLADTGQLDRAIVSFHRAIALKSDYAEAHLNLATCLLMRTPDETAWREFEWRWKSKKFPTPQRPFPQPRWDGSDLSGRTILIHAEQGFGDTIHFARYVPLVARQGGRVLIECQPELVRLMQQVKGLEGIEIISQSTLDASSLPAFDVHIPFLSLPLVLGEPVPSPRLLQPPYVRCDKETKWQRIVENGQQLKIGLSWAGSLKHRNDRNRSLPLQILSPLFQCKAKFYSLQLGDAARQIQNDPNRSNLIDLTPKIHDFSDTAGLIAALDLVICVDTAVAHLTGAMGKPVWVMLPFSPDWRWQQNRDDTPWYPTMRLFRQPEPGNWTDVIKRVAAHLADHTHIVENRTDLP